MDDKETMSGLWRYEVVQIRDGHDKWGWMAKCWKGQQLHPRAGIGPGPAEALQNLLEELNR